MVDGQLLVVSVQAGVMMVGRVAVEERVERELGEQEKQQAESALVLPVGRVRVVLRRGSGGGCWGSGRL